jgi:hypothetical protein
MTHPISFNFITFLKSFFTTGDQRRPLTTTSQNPKMTNQTNPSIKSNVTVVPKASDINTSKTNESTDHNITQLINKKINLEIVDEIICKQKFTTKSMDIINSESECCVCLNEHKEYMPMKCLHSLCVDCYRNMIAKKFTECPLCLQKFEMFTPLTACAIVVYISRFNLGVMYVPPIINTSGKIINCEVINFGDIISSPVSKFIELIKLRKYMFFFYDTLSSDIVLCHKGITDIKYIINDNNFRKSIASQNILKN